MTTMNSIDEISLNEITDTSQVFYQSVKHPPPCEDCVQMANCEANFLACRDFMAYVELEEVSGKDRQPSRALYIKIFHSHHINDLTAIERSEIRKRCRLRGVTHKMVADEFYILPQHVRSIMEETNE